MNAVQIQPRSSNDRKQYLQVPFRIAAAHPEMTLPPRSFTAADFSASHPFYEHSEATFFITENNGAANGRIAVLNNRNFNRFHDSRTAFFTHFECEDQPDTANALFDAASTWAKSRGLDSMVGPVGFLQTDPRGLRIRGQDQTASFSLPVHPAYYRSLLEKNGFEKHSDYIAGEMTDAFRINRRTAQLAERVRSKTDLRPRRTTTRRQLIELAPRLFEIYEKSGADAPMYYPMTDAERTCIKNQFTKIAHPRLIHLLEQPDGTIGGIMMALPNYAEVLQQHRGRLSRLAAACRQKHRPETVNLTTFYLHPAFQGRGLNLLLYSVFEEEALKLGCRKVLFGPVREGNSRQRSILEKMGIRQTICHRIYQRGIS